MADGGSTQAAKGKKTPESKRTASLVSERGGMPSFHDSEGTNSRKFNFLAEERPSKSGGRFSFVQSDSSSHGMEKPQP
jgi:hypothetical protein